VAPVVHRLWQSGQFLAQSPIYLDATVTIGWLSSADRLHARAVSFIGDHLADQRELQVSVLTLDETMFRLLRGMVANSRGVSPRTISLGREMKQNPKLLSAFTGNLKLAVNYVKGWATIVGAGPTTAEQIVDSWLDRCHDISGLRDALHLSLAEHSGAKTFATGDKDFRTVKVLPTAMHVVEL
jgi:predicted nucleic acid-binding protein